MAQDSDSIVPEESAPTKASSPAPTESGTVVALPLPRASPFERFTQHASEEVAYEVLKFLEPQDLRLLRRVNHRLKTLVENIPALRQWVPHRNELAKQFLYGCMQAFPVFIFSELAERPKLLFGLCVLLAAFLMKPNDALYTLCALFLGVLLFIVTTPLVWHCAWAAEQRIHSIEAKITQEEQKLEQISSQFYQSNGRLKVQPTLLWQATPLLQAPNQRLIPDIDVTDEKSPEEQPRIRNRITEHRE